ncbi:MAG: O-antigen ligase family protein [Acidobacteriota bacterium]
MRQGSYRQGKRTGKAARLSPEVAPYFVLLGLLFIYLPFNEGGMTNLAVLVIQTAVIAVSGMLLLSYWRRGELRLGIDWFELCLGLFFAVGLLSLARSLYVYSTFIVIIDFLFLGVFYLILKYPPCWQIDSSRLRYIIVGSAGLGSVVGLYQYLVQGEQRVRGGFLDPNYLATFLNIGIALVVGLLFFKAMGWAKRLLWLFLLLILSASLMLTKSRGGVLGFVVIFILIAMLKKKRYLLIPVAIIVVLMLVPNPLRDYVIQTARTDIYAFQRLDIWKMSLRMLGDHPWGGVSLGNFGLLTPAYNFPVEQAVGRYAKIPGQAHNSLLHWGVETGAGGVLVLTAILLFLLYYSVKLIKKRESLPNPSLIIGCIGGFWGVMVQSLFCNNLLNRAIGFHAIFLISVIHNYFITYCPEDRLLWTKWELRRLFGGHRRRGAVYIIAALVIVFYLVVFIPYYGHHLYSKGREYLGAGDLVNGVNYLLKAVKTIPIQPHYHAILGDTYRDYFKRKGDLSAFYYADWKYRQAVELDPREPTFVLRNAELYSALAAKGVAGEEVFETIEQSLLGGLSLRPLDPLLCYDLASFYHARGKDEQAERYLKRTVELEPNFIRAHHSLWEHYMKTNRLEEAQGEEEIGRGLASKFRDYPVGDDAYLRELLRIPEDWR